MSDARIRIAFCWTGISGYMGACWRGMSRRQGVDLRVFAQRSSSIYSFDRDVMHGVDWVELDDAAYKSPSAIAEMVDAFHPDVVVLAGWTNRAYRLLPCRHKRKGTIYILGMDTPRRKDWRQVLSPFLLHRFIRTVDGALVAGKRAREYAIHLGVPDSSIEIGLYGFDGTFHEGAVSNRQSRWPRSFLFVGRYVADKGIDTLLEAYRQYRSRSLAPWKLMCCGRGPLGEAVRRELGVDDRGFVQPRDLADVFASAGCAVLPSKYEPWGVALAEACGSGLPVICTSAVGASDELVQNGVNGFLVSPDDPVALADAMFKIDQSCDALPEMGRVSVQLADRFEASAWAENVTNYVTRILQRNGTTVVG